jgi:peroxiredoxin
MVVNFLINIAYKLADLSGADLGARSKRYAVLVDNGKIVWESVEKSPAE